MRAGVRAYVPTCVHTCVRACIHTCVRAYMRAQFLNEKLLRFTELLKQPPPLETDFICKILLSNRLN